jgi:hypothetical protein
MKKLLLLPLLILLAACRAGTADYTPQSFRYQQLAPITLNVSEIRVLHESQPTATAREFPTSPAQAVEHWTKDRLRAGGRSGLLEVVIEDAAVHESALQTKQGVSGFFTDEPSRRYDATLRVSFRLYSGAGALADADAHVTVARSESLKENASVADRERLFDRITASMMQEFNAQAEQQLRQYFGRFIVT